MDSVIYNPILASEKMISVSWGHLIKMIEAGRAPVDAEFRVRTVMLPESNEKRARLYFRDWRAIISNEFSYGDESP